MWTLWLAVSLGCGEGWLFSGTETENEPLDAADSDSDTDDTDDTDVI